MHVCTMQHYFRFQHYHNEAHCLAVHLNIPKSTCCQSSRQKVRAESREKQENRNNKELGNRLLPHSYTQNRQSVILTHYLNSLTSPNPPLLSYHVHTHLHPALLTSLSTVPTPSPSHALAPLTSLHIPPTTPLTWSPIMDTPLDPSES